MNAVHNKNKIKNWPKITEKFYQKLQINIKEKVQRHIPLEINNAKSAILQKEKLWL